VKELPVLIDYEAGTAPGAGLEVLEKRKSYPIPGKKWFLGHPERSLVTMPSELFRL
jgi:hypothetical protein